jgi:hypothetical protein
MKKMNVLLGSVAEEKQIGNKASGLSSGSTEKKITKRRR